jgi:hypothetical protein
MTSSGIEPATFLLVSYYLNQICYRMDTFAIKNVNIKACISKWKVIANISGLLERFRD